MQATLSYSTVLLDYLKEKTASWAIICTVNDDALLMNVLIFPVFDADGPEQQLKAD